MVAYEIPLLYYEREEKSVRYATVSNGKFEMVTTGSGYDAHDIWKGVGPAAGSASISSLGENSFVATLPSENILHLALVLGSTAVFVELDLRQEIEANAIAKVQCFDTSASTLTLLVADARATVLIISLHKDLLTPFKFSKVSIEKLLEDQDIEYSGAELHTTMITFLSSSTAIVAVSPLILTVNLDDPSLFVWTESHVHELMSASIGSILGRASSILFGRIEKIDVAPVSALSLTECWLFTLHADAKVRQWKLNSFGHPTEVYLVDFQFPDQWATTLAPFSFCVTAETYASNIAVVIHLQTRLKGSTLYLLQSSHDGSRQNVCPLVVPQDVLSIVTLTLQPGLSPKLFAVATKAAEDPSQVSQSVHLIYQSSRNGLHPSPLLIPAHFTLDGIADEELKRISAISATDINHIDTVFLRHIFRPVYPRGTGDTKGPSRASLEFAISQHLNSYELGSSSLEVETLKAIQQWRRVDQAMSLAQITHVSSDPVTDKHHGVSDETESHIRRWKAFTTTLWQQEAKIRDPICMSALPDGNIILMRSNVLCMLQEGVKERSNSEFDMLDDQALNLLAKVESQKSNQLHAIEFSLLEVIISCSLVLEDNRDDHRENELQNLGLWAQSGCFEKTQRLLKKVSAEKLSEYLETIPRGVLLPGLVNNFVPNDNAQGTVESPEVRQAASALVVRGVDAARRLFIGRCLLLLTHFKENSAVHNMVFSKYLHALAVLWTLSQHVATPTVAKAINEFFNESPSVRKRLNFGDEGPIRNQHESNRRTSLLDAQLMQISPAVSPDFALRDLVISLTKSVLEATFRKPRDSGSLFDMLPELGCLPTPCKDDIASDYPRLALRLLASTSKYVHDLPNVSVARTEALAECLYIEANFNPLQAENMRRRATNLLDPAAINCDIDVVGTSNAFEALISSSKDLPPVLDVVVAEQEMLKEIQHILFGYVDTVIRQDVRRLCDSESVRRAFLPFFCAGGLPDLNENQKRAVEALLLTLMRLSNLMNRLSIIERRTDRLGRLTKSENISLNLILQTSSTILKFEDMFLESTYKSMAEYVGLWSLLFRHAEAAGDWTTAVDACIKNPNSERRLKNFEQLVRGMVSAGALADLLALCSAGIKDTDFYEIAADVLAQDKMSERYNIQGTSLNALGCAYCLHANGGDWKRAAQAMDLRFGDSTRVLMAIDEDRDNGLVAYELSLSALASFIAIQLVPDPAQAYIMAGEFGPYPSITIVSDHDEEAVSKSILRRRLDHFTMVSSSNGRSATDDRLSRFMTAKDLLARAVRSVALETAFSHPGSTFLSAASLSRPQLAADIDTINNLASLGFFPLAFAVAKARVACYAERNGGCMPHGNDLLHVVFTDLLCKFLVPLACDQFGNNKDIVMDVDFPAKQITLFQVQCALNIVRWMNSAAPSENCSFVSTPRYGLRRCNARVLMSASSMELIRQIVQGCDSAATPMALAIAGSFLEQSNAHLPYWLEKHIIGVGEYTAGLFGNARKGKTRANASGLCTLYMQYGRLVDACEVVTLVLTGGEIEGNTRKASSVARVPEKGDIDFVPYNKIDLLWELVDYTLRERSSDESTKSKLRVSRMKMEEALKFHFNLLKVSEDGLRSARALAL